MQPNTMIYSSGIFVYSCRQNIQGRLDQGILYILIYRFLKYKIRVNDVKLFLGGMMIVFFIQIALNIWRINSHDHSIDAAPTESLLFSISDVEYARNLATKLTIFCFILTDPSNHTKRAYHAQATWARRCTKYGFVSSSKEKVLRMFDVRKWTAPYNRTTWNSMRDTLQALYRLRHMFQFFVKADDSSFIIMENLRHALEFEDPAKPFIMGHLHEPGPLGDKISGSVGYVISRGALELMIPQLDLAPACKSMPDVAEDIQIGLCAESVGVVLKDSIDLLGKSRFSNQSIMDILAPYPNGTARWLPAEVDYTQPIYDLRKLPASPLSISFGGIEPVMMYVLEYLVYHLRPIGITHKIVREFSTKVLNKQS